MITEVRTRIFTLANVITGLVNKVFYIEAIQGTAFPYAVFSQVANPVSRDSASMFEEIYFQIDIFDQTASGVEGLTQLVKTKFDDCESAFTLTNYICTRIEREFMRSAKVDNIFQTTLQYRLELTKI